MIALRVPYEEKDAAKKLGARWDRINNQWFVPDTIDYHPFQKWIPPEEYAALEKPVERTINFSDIFSLVSISQGLRVSLEADVKSLYASPYGNSAFLVLIESCDKPGRSLRAVIHYDSEVFEDIVALSDRRISIKGNLSFFFKTAQLQIETDQDGVSDIGPSSLWQKLDGYKKELTSRGVFDLPRKELPEILRCVGIISATDSFSGKNIKGKNDFYAKLHQQVWDMGILNDVDTPDMKPKTILESLQILFDERPDCDVACIVRGGGDPEQLIQYSEPDFVESLARFPIPILTGFAHADDADYLLCEKVVAFAAISPTGAADEINRIIAAENKKNKEARALARNEQQKLSYKDLMEKLRLAEERVRKLESQIIPALQQRIHELEHPEQKKSFWKRLFS